MNEQISIARVRDWYSRDGSGVERIWSAEVLALLDAVEQARLVMALKRPLNGGGPVWETLADALARFEFP